MGSADQKRAFLAVVLSGIVLFTWQFFFAPKTSAPQTNQTVSTPSNPSSPASQNNSAPLANTAVEPVTHEVKEVELANEKSKVRFTTDLQIKHLTGTNGFMPFEELLGKNSYIKFELTDISGTKVAGPWSNITQDQNHFQAQDLANGVRVFWEVDKEKIKFKWDAQSPKRLKITIQSPPLDKEIQNKHKNYLVLTTEVHRTVVGDSSDVDGTVRWLGLDYNYHLFALSFVKRLPGKVVINPAGQMVFESSEAIQSFESELVYAKKNYDELLAQGNNVELSVDFGFWGILAIPILRGLQFFHRYVPNYGLSIILLTILIRLLTFPLQYKSFKSMKKMQAIQPELTKIKEKYKDDAPRMQKETMELFKKAGANPLGGCLPLLLQMPVFIAFYKVLYEAVELVGAPFYGWIHDLSIKDPFFVLPVLMTAAMFLQQKLTPTTAADPTQQKVMLIMPLVFGFIMKDLPAGLVLYMCVSTLLGIGQQFLVNRSKA